MVAMPNSVTIPAGATSVAFTIAAEPVHGKPRLTEIGATANGITVTAMLTIDPAVKPTSTSTAIALCASASLQPCLTRAVLDAVATTTTPIVYEQQFTLYSPELSLLAETASTMSDTPAIAYEYVWFGGQPLAQIDNATGAIDWYFNDHLGTPILQTDTTGRVVWRAEYDPYGTVLAFRQGEAKHQPLRLPGQTAEAGSDRYYNVFRWYRAGWGRYTSSDPLEELHHLEPNLYLYARARPTSLVDPFGLISIDRRCYGCVDGYDFGGPDGRAVERGATRACAYSRRPKCRQLIQNLQFGITMDTNRAEPLGRCMDRLCGGDLRIYCAQNTDPRYPGACARANSLNQGSITLLRGEGSSGCYFDQGGGWSHTIFHEMVHVCGLNREGSESYENGPYSAIYRKIMWTCAGVLN